MNWLNGTVHLFGQDVYRSDIIGNLLGLTALALGWRRSRLTWPVQLLSGVVLVGAYWSAHLSGGVGKQFVVIVAAVWGWTRWQRGKHGGGDVEVRFATGRERAVLIGGTALGTVAVGTLFTVYPQLSWDAWPDAYIFVGTLAAMVAQARGWVEFWFAWVAVDLVGVPLAFNNGLVFSGFTYSVYFVLVLLGLRAWWLRGRTARPSTDRVLQGASA
ncbi:nicotinamide mononucleotide transporter family protein [Streptomyces sp. BE20]|uniref:nicotinamide mononucleotide transporter family protein n=1 Tax=Streptomycetaceae TaxID=2062 RepID=UPI002E7A006B|nr:MULTISPECIES: nicotinamide mononucleotide transporter family protein [unclassified Streptomyces]MED7954903.1 nicotinamide mononucleotide transporter family protein [Streptomyces sp. BE303]MEE1827911.1 nicotinamide mononucleotide transporter family protein [Streptomyces sp. BE20]